MVWNARRLPVRWWRQQQVSLERPLPGHPEWTTDELLLIRAEGVEEVKCCWASSRYRKQTNKSTRRQVNNILVYLSYLAHGNYPINIYITIRWKIVHYQCIRLENMIQMLDRQSCLDERSEVPKTKPLQLLWVVKFNKSCVRTFSALQSVSEFNQSKSIGEENQRNTVPAQSMFR